VGPPDKQSVESKLPGETNRDGARQEDARSSKPTSNVFVSHLYLLKRGVVHPLLRFVPRMISAQHEQSPVSGIQELIREMSVKLRRSDTNQSVLHFFRDDSFHFG
jgi:hypothetical protein